MAFMAFRVSVTVDLHGLLNAPTWELAGCNKSSTDQVQGVIVMTIVSRDELGTNASNKFMLFQSMVIHGAK